MRKMGKGLMSLFCNPRDVSKGDSTAVNVGAFEKQPQDDLVAENARLKKSLSILMGKYDVLLNVSNEILTAPEMFDRFRESLSSCQKEICIMTPWMSDHVVGKIKDKLKEVLGRGVRIKIRTGLNSNPLYQASAFKAFDILDDLKSGYDNFSFVPDQIIGASSVLIVDDSFYIVGGFNFLGIDEESSPKEVGVYCTEKTKLEALKLRYFDF